MDTGITSALDHPAGLTQRSCKRPNCATNESGLSKSSPTRCCDESCLVEVARRECMDQCKPKAAGCQHEGKSEDCCASSAAAANKQQPCVSHYLKTRDRYGKILDNLGCICKVLMSLNIETCCVIHTPASSRHSLLSNKSSQASLGKVRNSSDDRASLNSRISKTSKAQSDAQSCKDSCCGNSDCEADLDSTPQQNQRESEACQDSCCDEPEPEPVKQQADVDDFEQTCCSKGCCADIREESQAESSMSMHLFSKKRGCSQIASKTTTPTSRPKGDKCTEKGRCSSDVSDACSSSSCGASPQEVDAVEVVKTPTVETAAQEIQDHDIEKGVFGSEHLVVNVQGMTCTGCERKLFRSLSSVPQVKNVKASLLLGLAEFDLTESGSFDSSNIIPEIERMTGFKCTMMKQTGEEIELLVNGNINEFRQDPPSGVKDISIITKSTIRVSYNPSVIGIRDLLSDPFFRNTRLAPPTPRASIASGRAHVRYTFFMTLLSAILTAPVLILAWAPLPEHQVLYESISLGLATLVQTIIAGPFYVGALKALIFSRMIEMDLLIVLSTTTAYVYSVIAYGYLMAGKPLAIGEFFETSTLLVTLIMVGRAVSAYARQKATETISLESLQQPTALLVDPVSNSEQEIDARLLQYRDVFRVLPETSIVTDGIITDGETEVDESMITGEAIPVIKKPGMPVVAGSINHSGTILVRLTHLPSENTIQTISAMVDKAKALKPRIQEIADRVASYFVPVVLAMTILIFIIWVGVGKSIRHQDASTACINAMTYAISALIVSCPCAIGLAVPLVVVIASGVAAKHGIIFKTAETVSLARKVTHVVFDKTGTLTQGELSVTSHQICPSGVSSETNNALVLGLTSNSKHPVAVAIAAYLKREYPALAPIGLSNPLSIPGAGIMATYGHAGFNSHSHELRGGNPHWLDLTSHPDIQPLFSQSLSIFAVTLDNEILAVFGLKDQLRPDAVQVVQKLKQRGIEVSIVSGDNQPAVNAVATQLDVPLGNVRAGCRPEDKSAFIRTSMIGGDPNDSTGQSKKDKKPIVLFCGDGTNDAPALAEATIGLHISSHSSTPSLQSPTSNQAPATAPTPTSAIAQTAASAILLHPSLTSIPTLLDISAAFHRRVLFNFSWAFIYNIAAVLLAAGVGAGSGSGGAEGNGDALNAGGVRIPPQFAGLGEIVSVLPVVVGAVGLRWVRF